MQLQATSALERWPMPPRSAELSDDEAGTVVAKRVRRVVRHSERMSLRVTGGRWWCTIM